MEQKTESSPRVTSENEAQHHSQLKIPTLTIYKFLTFSGNHPENVRAALIRRGNFTEVFLYKNS